jgi:hypothetical protein
LTGPACCVLSTEHVVRRQYPAGYKSGARGRLEHPLLPLVAGLASVRSEVAPAALFRFAGVTNTSVLPLVAASSLFAWRCGYAASSLRSKASLPFGGFRSGPLQLLPVYSLRSEVPTHRPVPLRPHSLPSMGEALGGVRLRSSRCPLRFVPTFAARQPRSPPSSCPFDGQSPRSAKDHPLAERLPFDGSIGGSKPSVGRERRTQHSLPSLLMAMESGKADNSDSNLEKYRQGEARLYYSVLVVLLSVLKTSCRGGRTPTVGPLTGGISHG